MIILGLASGWGRIYTICVTTTVLGVRKQQHSPHLHKSADGLRQNRTHPGPKSPYTRKRKLSFKWKNSFKTQNKTQREEGDEEREEEVKKRRIK